MPNISWNDIKHNALLFSRRWETVTSEQAEKQTFWNEFFAVFGISRRLVATFESPVKHRPHQLYWPSLAAKQRKALRA